MFGGPSEKEPPDVVSGDEGFHHRMRSPASAFDGPGSADGRGERPDRIQRARAAQPRETLGLKTLDMMGSKIYIPHAKPLSLGLEKALRTFVEKHPPAAIAFVRSGDGELTMIETGSPKQAEQVAAALTASSLSPEPLTAVL